MIKVNIYCGMGNQMFQYAYARALSEEFGDSSIVISDYFSCFVNLYMFRKFKPYKNGLTNFYLNENVKISENKFQDKAAAFFEFLDFCYYHQKFFRKPFNEETFRKRSERGIYQQSTKCEYTFYRHSKKSGKNKVVKDLFLCGKYFENIQDIIMRELKVRTPPSEKNAAMIEELRSCNSVCMHIRGGDYFEKRFSHLRSFNEDYFARGMEYINERVKDPVFYIFSNTGKDLEWIKKNYHLPYPVKYVDLNNPDYEDLRLMYNCKHFIISSSTFGWWGSYLSENKDKIIIAPEPWTTIPYESSIDVYRDDMIKLKVDPEKND